MSVSIKNSPDTESNKKYKLLDWIDKSKLNWRILSENENVFDLLDNLLEKNQDKINWNVFSNKTHKIAIELLEKNPDKINWDLLSSNPAAIEILKKNPDKINWSRLSSNANNDAIDMLEQNLDKIDWNVLSVNPNAIRLLEKNLDKINWHYLSGNPNAIRLLEKNLDKVNWHYLSGNPNAIRLLKNNPEKIDYITFSHNISFFTEINENLSNKNTASIHPTEQYNASNEALKERLHNIEIFIILLSVFVIGLWTYEIL